MPFAKLTLARLAELQALFAAASEEDFHRDNLPRILDNGVYGSHDVNEKKERA